MASKKSFFGGLLGNAESKLKGRKSKIDAAVNSAVKGKKKSTASKKKK